jgi:hypothetical protein
MFLSLLATGIQPSGYNVHVEPIAMFDTCKTLSFYKHINNKVSTEINKTETSLPETKTFLSKSAYISILAVV